MMNTPSIINKRQILLTFLLLTLISVTSIECMFANGFIIPYTIASRFFQQRNQEPKSSPSLPSSEKQLAGYTDSFNQNENEAKAILPHLFPLNLAGKSVPASQSVEPSAASSSSSLSKSPLNSPSNSNSHGKPILKLRIGTSLNSQQGKSSSSKEKFKFIPIDMSVLKSSPPAKSFAAKTSFKPITRPTDSRLLANPLSLPTLDRSLIDDDFTSSDNKQQQQQQQQHLGTNSHFIHSPQASPSRNSPLLHPLPPLSSAEVRDFQEAQLENTLNNDFDQRAKSHKILKHKQKPSSTSSFPLPLNRQMNSNDALNDGPNDDHIASDEESFFGNFGSQKQRQPNGREKNPLLATNSPSFMTKDLHNSMKGSPEISEADRRNMIRNIARVVEEGGPVSDELVKQLNEKTGQKLSPENIASLHSPSSSRLGGRYSPVHEFVNFFYGPIGSESEGDALTDFLMSDANAISSPGKRVKSIFFHSPQAKQQSESTESKPLATEVPSSSS